MSTAAGATAGPLKAFASGPLTGRVRMPADASISHRALILGALAIGETVIEGLIGREDIAASVRAMQAFGATVAVDPAGTIRVKGVGVGGFLEPEDVVECGHSGTTVRLAIGLVASQAIAATFSAGATLRARPMGRVLEPLRRMGAQVVARSRDRLPLTIRGADVALPIDYRLPAGSAEAKSAVLFAALNTAGVTSIIEPVATRDHSERMLAAFGAALEIDRDGEGARVIRVEGRRDLKPQRLVVPGDPGAAAFVIVAALVIEGSDVTIEGVLVNPLRIGLIETLVEMGGDIAFDNHRMVAGEPVADLRVHASRLKGIVVPPARAAAMIDDYPVLAVAAAFAEGKTVMDGLGELRQQDTDRLSALAAALAANGVEHEEGPESLTVTGSLRPAGGGRVAAGADPRIALSALVLGLGAANGVLVEDARTIAMPFPGFAALMGGLGALFETPEPAA
ncbi:3-phosphoshikimate 1-carboxyvinyltransferase [Kaistia soli DSM 19436]|uniref:3-phosphoshikimate 1-carboxyvinyltransferase n=1 Tax=Kaistia soli DSM 19436 TaxID=1122133 RepID=A0A1M5D8B2_9HYPH|nr:3-phosphoshikimate 1-carboxyvinyltransferase [Kaistia soli]SHF63299.1 3-phosphoshikimate 1-carboxyvinyltransferase [Kaistia soli DSM 19436]